MKHLGNSSITELLNRLIPGCTSRLIAFAGENNSHITRKYYTICLLGARYRFTNFSCIIFGQINYFYTTSTPAHNVTEMYPIVNNST